MLTYWKILYSNSFPYTSNKKQSQQGSNLSLLLLLFEAVNIKNPNKIPNFKTIL